ncbi:hypothetical protein TrCOL_g6595 [Triparma columacea]|uniref:Actin n=1 Tax=Triparma columacea TaxID=722753 RepID=A0A9W7GPE9_9STRA|nr:hypothetical protein TrCOL_g6595 [Triparma columacea]
MDGDGALVLDVGSSSVKCGFSGEDAPRVLVPSVVASLGARDQERAKVLRRLGTIEGGVKSLNLGGEDTEVQHVVNRGKVVDWDNMEKLLEGVFAVEMDAMQSDSLSVPILVAESPNTSNEDREKLTQILFENFKVSGVAFANSAVLSLFASGRTRGMLLECGSGVSHAVPVFEGFSLPHAVLKLDAAGQDVTSYLQKNFRKQLSYQSIRDIKHELANCSPVSGPGAITKKTEYELPDGTTVLVDGIYTSACIDQLFDPDEYGVENLDGGLGEIVFKSIQSCDTDVQADLFSNVVLAGGTTMTEGFSDRLKREIMNNGSDNPQISGLNVVPDARGNEPGYNSQRKTAAWIGGSILASLDTFAKISISKQDYEDTGSASIVHRKAVL